MPRWPQKEKKKTNNLGKMFEPLKEDTTSELLKQEISEVHPPAWTFSLDGMIEEHKRLRSDLERLDKSIAHRKIDLGLV